MRFRGLVFVGLVLVSTLLGAFAIAPPAQAAICGYNDQPGECPPGESCLELAMSQTWSCFPDPEPVSDPAAGVCDITGLDDDLPDCEVDDNSTEVNRQQDGYEDIVGGTGLIFANICNGPRPTATTEGEACACRDEGRCSLDDVLQVFVNITILILGISGSIVLLMFIYGGFLWVTSRGEAKRVEKGKDTMTQAAVGFAIILLSYAMINFLIATLAGDRPAGTIDETIDNADDSTRSLDSSP